MYHEVIKLGREVMIDLGLSDPSLTVEENPPGRGRGSSVALLAGYLIGLSHIDPLKYNLSLERFLPADTMSNVPDIDLDFPRSIREDLILRTHQKWGWEHAALTGTIATYMVKGAVRDLGKALGLPEEEVDQLAKQVDWGSAKGSGSPDAEIPHFQDQNRSPGLARPDTAGRGTGRFSQIYGAASGRHDFIFHSSDRHCAGTEGRYRRALCLPVGQGQHR